MAKLASIVPPLLPTKPPALLLLVMLPKAKLFEIEPVLLPANPPASPSKLDVLGAVDATLPNAAESVMVPALSPTRPPTPKPPPLTLPIANDAVIVAVFPLKATRPPAKLSSEETAPSAHDPVILPLLKPTRPPAEVFEPAVTSPLANDVLIVP